MHANFLFTQFEGKIAAGAFEGGLAAAIRQDPNRVLRAFRQGAELNFAIDPGTFELIRRDGPGLKNVAAERSDCRSSPSA